MVHHMVMWNFKPEVSEAEKPALKAAMKDHIGFSRSNQSLCCTSRSCVCGGSLRTSFCNGKSVS